MEPMKLNRAQIMEVLAHRDPIQLLDEITELVPGEYAKGSYRVNPELPVFKGYFPGHPVLPATHIMETVSQLGGVMVGLMPAYQGKGQLLLGFNYARFHKMIHPGDVLELHSKLVAERKEKAILTVEGRIYVKGELAAEVSTAIAVR